MKKIILGMIARLFFSSAQAVVITSGTGTVSTASSTAFQAKAVAGPILGSWVNTNYAAGKQISIFGTMTLSGSVNNGLNDKLGLVIGNASGPAVLATGGNITAEATYALGALTTVGYAGPNELHTIAKAGVVVTNNVVVAGIAAGGSINYAINIQFAPNFANGIDAADHVFDYQLGFDYNKDGAYEVIESGTFTAFEDDRIRIGFAVNKNATGTALAGVNDYTYTVQTGYVAGLSVVKPRTFSLVILFN